MKRKRKHSEKMASCPTCGSEKREVKFTSHFSGMPVLECSDPWHGCDSAKEDDSTFRCDECGGSLQDGYVTFCRKCGGCDSAKESAEPEEWISVEERLPEITEEWKDGPNHYGESDRVLFIAQGIIMVGVLDKSGTWATFDGEAFKQVTHWMPLPKPPEHAQKGK